MRKPALQSDYVPVAEWVMSADEDWRIYNNAVRRAAFQSFAQQLIELCDKDTPIRFIDLACEWWAESLR